jgi:recyclin-1
LYPMAPRESSSTFSRGSIPPVTMQVLTPTKFVPAPPPKMTLPIAIVEQIVDHMSVPSQLTFARTSRAMRDMVYDDSRWVSKLKAMGVWNEEAARKAVEEELMHKRDIEKRAKEEAVLGRPVMTPDTTTIFDAALEKRKLDPFGNEDLLDFQPDSPEAFGEFQSVSVESPAPSPIEPVLPLKILSSVVSRRGQARQEFGRVYEVLSPLFVELGNANSLEEAAAFRHWRKPEEQAKLLHAVTIFGRSASVDNWTKCQKRIAWITETFEREMIIEFEE